jgi:hypothetical protein
VGGRQEASEANPAALIGYVEAPDAEQAIRIAIREFGITNPEHQKRLVAQRAEGGGSNGRDLDLF